jgi:O-succinylbenzoate synthase
MKIDRIILREIRLPFINFFETSFGRTYHKDAVLVEIQSDSLSGWGESVAGEGPFYSPEDHNTAWYILTEFLAPRTMQKQIVEPQKFILDASSVRGHNMAKAAIESALWDLNAKAAGVPLWKLLGGSRKNIPCGVSIGIQDTPGQLLEKIDQERKAGYQKIKVKIKPGWDFNILTLIRKRFPRIPLMADANSAYTTDDIPALKRLDEFELMMVEQPLYDDDILEHAKLQSTLDTPVCLDESIRHARDARHAIESKACRIINIKLGRVGGLGEAVRIHDLCRTHGIPVWCGGMLETGIGRAHNIALSTLDNFTIPGDVSASKRYFERDTVTNPVEVSPDGFIEAPMDPGIGFDPDLERIDQITVRKMELPE